MATNWVQHALAQKKSGVTPQPTPTGLMYTPSMTGATSLNPPPTASPPVNPLGQNGQGVLADWLNRYGFNQPAAPEVTPVATPDPLQDIYDLYKQLLLNMGSGNVTMQSPEALRALAEKQINLQFDPQINALKQEMAERKKRYAANKKELLELWNDLSLSYGDESGLSSSYYDSAISDQSDRASNFEQMMRDNYDESLDYMGNEFDKLGIQDTSAYTDPLMSSGLEEANRLYQNSNDGFEQYLNTNASAEGDYLSGMADSARMHGAEGAQDLLEELTYYLDSANSNLTNLRSQRGTSLELLIAQMAQQQQEAQAKAQQQMFDNLLNAGKFRLDLQGMSNNLNQAQTSNSPTYNSGLLGANQQFTGNPNANNLSGILQELLQKQEFREGRFQAADGTIVKLTPAQAASYALQEAQNRGLGAQDTLQLMNAVYAYFGQLGR